MSFSYTARDPLGIIERDDRLDHVPMGDEEQRLVGALREKIDFANRERLPRERAWEFNRLQLKGEQNVVSVMHPMTGDVLRLSLDNDEFDEFPSVDNVLQPTARAFVGKLIRIIPSGVVLPRSEDRNDMEAAEVMDSYLAFRWRNLGMRLKYKRAMEYVAWAGTGIFQLAWNVFEGRRITVCPRAECGFKTEVEHLDQPCPVCMANEGVESPLKSMPEGDMQLVGHDPRDFFPEPGVAEIEDMQWCYVRTAQPVGRLRRWYPELAGEIQEQEEIYSDRNTTYTVGLLGNNYENTQLKDHAWHYEFHEAPSGEYPEGRIIYMVNDRIVKMTKRNVYYTLFGHFPFYALRGDRYPREFWGASPIDQAWLLQKERNNLSTQTREHRELTNNPKVLIPENCGVDQDRFTTMPGEVIKFKSTPAGKPSYLTPPSMAEYTYNEFERLKYAIAEKFGVTEHELGNTASDQSGRYAAIVESQANETVAPIVLENVAAWMDLHVDILTLGQKFDPPGKVWAIPGTDRPRSFAWDEVKIQQGWDLIVEDEDSLSKNPALRLQQALGLWESGVYTDPTTGIPDKKAFMRHAGLRMPGMSPDIDAAHRAYAAQIPDMVERGIPVMPQPWDDPEICAEELLVWLRGEGMRKPEPVRRMVANLWFLYSMALQPANPMHQELMPQQALMPGGAQQVGGPSTRGPQGGSQSPQQPGVGTGNNQMQQTPSTGPRTSASQTIQQADQRGESLAKPSGGQEGSTL